MSFIRATLSEANLERIRTVLCRIQRELDALLVLLVHRDGQHIASEGPARELDLTALSSLAVASLAATDGLAQLVGEKEFAVLFQQGKCRSIHISSVDAQFCLVLLVGEAVSPGLVRWKVRKASTALIQAVRALEEEPAGNRRAGAPFEGQSGPRCFSDEDIEKLFGQ